MYMSKVKASEVSSSRESVNGPRYPTNHLVGMWDSHWRTRETRESIWVVRLDRMYRRLGRIVAVEHWFGHESSSRN